ncbi:MAG TPA: lamin tail domain-containing protein [Anaerolineae bacterium]|nr:lamin tail domain-containing protein [Anaerolineae bacterium]
MSWRWRTRSPMLLCLVLLASATPAVAAEVEWPPSSALVVGEVVTGGPTGSDEYVELYNAADAPALLDELELVYASATGKTVTRKHTWSQGHVAAGSRVLLANVDGIYAAMADHTYSGGLSATGGSVVLRQVGGSVIDSLSWGDAGSSFVEGTPGVAPEPGSSLERRPGRGAANHRDTNDNAADSVINPEPVAEGSLAIAPPTPAPTPKPTPTPEPTPAPTPKPTPSPVPTMTPPPSASMAISEARRCAIGSRVSVTGTVTVQPGRILGDRTLVVQDAGGGIAVRVPMGVPHDQLSRGAILRVSGTLADPYGNLELRPEDPADLSVIGSGGLPEPIRVDSSGIGEAIEGSLAAITATLVDIDRSSSSAISLTVRDERGDARVYAFAPVELDAASLERGQRLRVTGIVGQRASRSGAPDGHRLWPRAMADVAVLDGAPVPTRPPGGGSDDDEAGTAPPRVAISDATPGHTVTIVGVVTAKAGLVDSEGRRVTVQDRSGAILVRYPAGLKPAGVGQIIRATGEVGTWYDTRQLEALTVPRLKGHANPVPLVLRQPPSESDEWQLVSVTVHITHLERDGDTWRAEGELSTGEALPVVGLAGSGTNPEPLQPGRSARVTGIVRRAHPAATDQRFAVAPRSPSDIRLGRRTSVLGGGEGTGAEGDDEAAAGTETAAFSSGGTTVLTATLGSLDALTDRVVRVGGRLEAIEDRHLTLDDGTGRATVRLAAEIGSIEPAPRPGEVVNATGRVQRGRDGPEVVVGSVADLRWAAATVAYSAAGALSAESRPTSAAAPVTTDSTVAPVPAGHRPLWDEGLPLAAVTVVAGSSLGLLLSAALLARRARRLLAPPSAGSTGPGG